MPVTLLYMDDTMNPAKIDILTVTICKKVPHLEHGTDDDNTKRTQILAMICEQYPPEAWTNVYTDGSATNAIYVPSGRTEAANAVTRRHYSNYKAEALVMAISLAVDSQQKSTMTVFLTGAFSVIQALTNNTLPHLAKALQLLSNNCRVVVQWIPAHCGVPGNEQADTPAKQCAQTEQPGDNVSYQEKAIITKALMISSQEKCAYHLLIGQSK